MSLPALVGGLLCPPPARAVDAVGTWAGNASCIRQFQNIVDDQHSTDHVRVVVAPQGADPMFVNVSFCSTYLGPLSGDGTQIDTEHGSGVRGTLSERVELPPWDSFTFRAAIRSKPLAAASSTLRGRLMGFTRDTLAAVDCRVSLRYAGPGMTC